MRSAVMSKLCKSLCSVKILFLMAIQLLLITVYRVFGGYTWFEAQQLCQNHNDHLTLDTSKSNNFYWTGNYQRLSDWIKILGCYNASRFVNPDISSLIKIASVGLCQEFCENMNHSTFAIKAESCFCLEDDFISPYEQINSTFCNYGCNNTNDDKLSTLCGGTEAFNVFSTEKISLKRPESGNCVSLECNPLNQNFAAHNCTDALNVICTIQVTRDEYKSWRGHLETCAIIQQYPVGNIEFSNASSSCSSLTLRTTDPKWVGIIREIFLTRVKENHNHENERGEILMCQKCQSSSCELSNCNEDVTNHVFCEKSTFMAMSSKTETEKVSIVSLVAPIIIIFVTGIIICLVVVIYKRRKRLQNENHTKVKDNATDNSKIMDDRLHDDRNPVESESYFVLEKSNQNYHLTSKANNSTNPYSFTEEGQYDHLGGNGRKKEENDDTYNHALAVNTNDYSDYDLTRKKNGPEIENTYDKTKLKGNHENEYNEIKLRNEDI